MSLWQKPETERPARPASPGTTPPSSTPTSSVSPTWESKTEGGGFAKIGQSIQIKGELTGNEDLTIDGKVEGKIVLTGHNLTIGTNGQIDAEIQANSVLVEGEVVGNITADDKVEIASSGSVQGDLTAPRVALADGSSFKGSIDMGNNKKSSSSTGAGTQTASRVPELARSASASKS